VEKLHEFRITVFASNEFLLRVSGEVALSNGKHSTDPVSDPDGFLSAHNGTKSYLTTELTGPHGNDPLKLRTIY
jgi:hypothetical protein